jgi:transcription termination factor Rho
MEIHLDRVLADKRLFPAIDPIRSGTRKEELLMSEDELKRNWVLRKILNDMPPTDAITLLRDKMSKTKTNADFLASLHTQK